MGNRNYLAASHLPLLIKAFFSSKGDILEIGTGYFSTMVLHWFAELYQRHVYSYENEEKWYTHSLQYASEYHHIVKCDDWASADFESKHWGVIFIDHSPHHRRGIELVRLKDHADFIVVHDTEPRQEKRYHVAEGLASFKYRSDDIRVVPHTTVVSNFRPEAASLALP